MVIRGIWYMIRFKIRGSQDQTTDMGQMDRALCTLITYVVHYSSQRELQTISCCRQQIWYRILARMPHMFRGTTDPRRVWYLQTNVTFTWNNNTVMWRHFFTWCHILSQVFRNCKHLVDCLFVCLFVFAFRIKHWIRSQDHIARSCTKWTLHIVVFTTLGVSFN